VKTNDVSTATCECPRCRAHAAGLGPGPYAPAEYALIAPPVVVSPNENDIDGDPGVVVAQQALEEARAVVDAAYQLWLSAVAAHQTASLLDADPYQRNAGGEPVGLRQGPRTDRGRIAELAEAEKEARERRDVAQARFVRAHDRLRQAQWRAQLQATRNGRNGRKGRR
jgi:hypothetical protein